MERRMGIRGWKKEKERKSNWIFWRHIQMKTIGCVGDAFSEWHLDYRGALFTITVNTSFFTIALLSLSNAALRVEKVFQQGCGGFRRETLASLYNTRQRLFAFLQFLHLLIASSSSFCTMLLYKNIQTIKICKDLIFPLYDHLKYSSNCLINM